MAQWAKIAPADAATIGAVKTAVARLEGEEKALIAAGQDPIEQATAMAGLVDKGRIDEVRALLKAYTDKKQAEFDRHTEAQAAAQSSAVAMLAIGGLLALGLSLLMGFLLNAAIAKPVSAMTGAMA